MRTPTPRRRSVRRALSWSTCGSRRSGWLPPADRLRAAPRCVRLWAIEGTGSFGAGLTTALRARCERIVEVDRPQRPARRGGVKGDDIDAVRAARQALAGVGLSEPRRRGDRETIRVLRATHAQAVTFRTRAISALHALVASAPDGPRERLRTLPLGQLLHTCAGLRDSSQRTVEESATVLALGPPHAGRWSASGRPPNSRSSSTGWPSARPRPARPVGNWPGRGRSAPPPDSDAASRGLGCQRNA